MNITSATNGVNGGCRCSIKQIESQDQTSLRAFAELLSLAAMRQMTGDGMSSAANFIYPLSSYGFSSGNSLATSLMLAAIGGNQLMRSPMLSSYAMQTITGMNGLQSRPISNMPPLNRYI